MIKYIFDLDQTDQTDQGNWNEIIKISKYFFDHDKKKMLIMINNNFLIMINTNFLIMIKNIFDGDNYLNLKKYFWWRSKKFDHDQRNFFWSWYKKICRLKIWFWSWSKIFLILIIILIKKIFLIMIKKIYLSKIFFENCFELSLTRPRDVLKQVLSNSC